MLLGIFGGFFRFELEGRVQVKGNVLAADMEIVDARLIVDGGFAYTTPPASDLMKQATQKLKDFVVAVVPKAAMQMFEKVLAGTIVRN